MDINVIIQVIASIFTVIITAIIAPLISNYYIKRKFRNMQYLIDSHQVLQSVNEDFKKNFVDSTIQENLFFVMTGIKTNYNSINSYIELKNLLGKNFGWPIIRSAHPHFKFDDGGKIYIKLSKSKIIYKNLSLIAALVLLLIGLGLLIYFSQFEITKGSEILLMYIIVFPFFLMAYLAISSITSIIDANIIQKVLEKNS